MWEGCTPFRLEWNWRHCQFYVMAGPSGRSQGRLRVVSGEIV